MTDRGLLQLAADLRLEVEALDRIVAEAAQCTALMADRSPTPLELRGTGDIVHELYNAVERYLERVAVEMNGGLPAGPDPHARLLQRMAHELPDVRPAVLSQDVARRLDEYLRFRHLFRHRYGFELEWPRLRPLIDGIAHLSPDLRRELLEFEAQVRDLAAAAD